MADIIQIRRGTAALWTSVNPILHEGELGEETDTGFIKIGDGVTVWTVLPYIVSGGGSGDVVGPASAVDGNVVVYDGATGKLVKDAGLFLSNSVTVAATAPVAPDVGDVWIDIGP